MPRLKATKLRINVSFNKLIKMIIIQFIISKFHFTIKYMFFILIFSLSKVLFAQNFDSIIVNMGTAPVIDGTISPGEWEDVDPITFNNAQGEIKVYVKQNDTMLFFASNIQDSSFYWGDDIVIGLDTDYNGGNHPQTDDIQLYLLRDKYALNINLGTGLGWNFTTDSSGILCKTNSLSKIW